MWVGDQEGWGRRGEDREELRLTFIARFCFIVVCVDW